MNSKFSRRDFLKLMALAPAALAARPLVSALEKARAADAPHILVFVFDAWTAHNLQLHGYPRRTMPNLERFAERCFVYHNHYSTGSFTVPGTASLLTGLYPQASLCWLGLRRTNEERRKESERIRSRT